MGRKDFFFKKEAKNFYPCGPRQSQRARQSPKVFWFFFSKKNCFLLIVRHDFASHVAIPFQEVTMPFIVVAFLAYPMEADDALLYLSPHQEHAFLPERMLADIVRHFVAGWKQTRLDHVVHADFPRSFARDSGCGTPKLPAGAL
jgi:hypothetical protein